MVKLFKRLIIFLLVTILIIGAALVGVYFYVKNTYEIDLIRTVSELKTLSEPVDESTLIHDPFSVSDMIDVQNIINDSSKDFITQTSEDSFKINFDNISSNMQKNIKLNGRQVAALAQEVIDQELNGKIAVGESSIGVAVKQVSFYKNTEGFAVIESVLALDLNELISKVPSSFPYSLVKSKIPKTLYVTSCVEISKDVQPFSYTVLHSYLKVNNLTGEDTEDLFHTLDVLMKTGSAKDLNVKIGTAIMDALVGSPTANGIAYSLKDKGAKDYAFVYEGADCYFTVVMDLI